MTKLNQIRKEYNDSLRDIPERKLKELFDKLYYELYHSFFIDEDEETFNKTLTIIESLIKNIKQPKPFNAGREAIIRQPVNVMVELYNKKNNERRNLINELFRMFLLVVGGENDIFNLFIEIIDGIEEGKHSLQFLRKQMVKLRDRTSGLLELHKKDIERTIKYYESKENLTEFDIEALEKLKEIYLAAFTNP